MPRFVFELEAVLEQRERERDARQREVAELERECLTLEDEIDLDRLRMQDERAAMRYELVRERMGQSDSAIGGVDLTRVRRQADASMAIITSMEGKVMRLSGLHDQIDRARLELIQASIRFKALESLRQRRYDAWASEVKRAEAASYDDMAVMRAGMRDELDDPFGSSEAA